ncbi:hypothetical protein HY570_00195 [Candidatus Micrarchaeota archaeon]|nr:hypothetical protein [Candidatus Micrarchaeota archaeon]
MPIIVYSSLDLAGVNITKQIKEKYKFQKVGEAGLPTWELSGIRLIEVDVPPPNAENLDFETDYYIFASKHKSESKKPAFTVHAVGNWNSADYGGKPKNIGYVYPSKMKIALNEVKRLSEGRFDWDVTMEATHHGPDVKKPLLFVELGSTENEWKNEEAAEIVADAIMSTIGSEHRYKTAFAIGGSHYAPSFNRLMFEKDYAVGHILPKYHIENTSFELFQQGIEKSCEKISRVILDWKGMNKEQRELILKYVADLGIDYEKI